MAAVQVDRAVPAVGQARALGRQDGDFDKSASVLPDIPPVFWVYWTA